MKNLIIVCSLAIASFAIMACNNVSKSSTTNTDTIGGKNPSSMATSPTAKGGIDTKTTASVKEMVENYLQLKNALTKDNSSDAATAGKALSTGFGKLDQSVLSSTQKKSFTDIADDAKEMAGHIGMSGGKLPHQREHFDMLSKDMYDLVKLFGAAQPLFVDHCPMYNNKKGAIWLSETKEIKNPYMGSGMSTSGTIQEVLK
ncbi:MAG: DUF3347 domain-containing protein [Mucilaginibacter sp.]